jgi:hypothetical protein
MARECSLPYAQEHATGLYPEADEFNTGFHTPFLSDAFQY